MKHILAGQDCSMCIYSTVFEDDKGHLKAYCELKDKEYYWGASIPCEDKALEKRDFNG